MTGTIKTLNTEKGFGFIKATDGSEYFFHKTAMVNEKFDRLRKGQQVTFEPTESEKGLRAEDVTA